MLAFLNDTFIQNDNENKMCPMVIYLIYLPKPAMRF